MSMRPVACLFLALALLLPAQLRAVERPVQLSLFTPLQIFPEDDDITFFRLNLIYGRNASVTGLDLGLVNHTTGSGSIGIQWGFVSYNQADFTGWQYNAVNTTAGDFKGFQWGVINYARSARGFQLGLVNYTESMYGLQVGLANIIRQGGVLPVMPIVNWSF